MKKGKAKGYLIRLNPDDPDDRAVIDMLEHRQGLTITGFFVNAVLSGSKSIWCEEDRDFLRQTLREELNRLPLQQPMIAADATMSTAPSSQSSESMSGTISEETVGFMQELGFD